jgi:hypothetical protein
MKLLTNSLTQRTGWLLPVPLSSKAGWIVGSMRFSGWIGQQVIMLKRMFVFQSYMQIIVLVVLGQMHPYPKMLATLSSTVRRTDGTMFPNAFSGTIYVVDTKGNTVYTVRSDAFQPGGAYSASDSDWYFRQGGSVYRALFKLNPLSPAPSFEFRSQLVTHALKDPV